MKKNNYTKPAAEIFITNLETHMCNDTTASEAQSNIFDTKQKNDEFPPHDDINDDFDDTFCSTCDS